MIIGLINGGDGGPYCDDEIASAKEFIRTLGLASLVAVSEPVDGAVECVFTIEKPEPAPVEWIWVLYGCEKKLAYDEFGLMPLCESSLAGNQAKMLPLTSPAHKDKFIQRLIVDAPKGVPVTVVRNVENKILLWWRSAPDTVRRAFSVLPSFEQSWERYGLGTRMNIYNYCIIKENGLEFSDMDELSLLGGISTELSDIALETIFGKSVEDMCDDEGCFLEKYQSEFNRLKDEIEDSICAIEFKKE